MRWVVNLIPWISGLCGVFVYLLFLPLAAVEHPRNQQLFVLPPTVVRVVSLQFKEVASDIAFLNALTYLGGTTTQPDTHRYLPEQYEWIYSTLKNSVILDPYFLDPYYVMNAALIWDRYKIDEVNVMIASGADKRTWDPLLPFYAGFNYYYFLNDSMKSFYYLKEASQRLGGNPFYDNLAARVAYKANKTEFAISYLENQIQQADMQGNKEKNVDLERRLNALKGIRKIEVASESYKKLFGTLPTTISELLSRGLLPSIPSDPYGGSFYIAKDGSIKTTSDMTFANRKK